MFPPLVPGLSNPYSTPVHRPSTPRPEDKSSETGTGLTGIPESRPAYVDYTTKLYPLKREYGSY